MATISGTTQTYDLQPNPTAAIVIVSVLDSKIKIQTVFAHTLKITTKELGTSGTDLTRQIVQYLG